MPEPIEFRALVSLRDALQAIHVNDGFFYTVADVAVKLNPNHNIEALIAPEGPRPFVVIEVKPERWTYEPASELDLVVPVTVHWVHDTDPTNDESLLLTYLRGCADIERAITVDIERGSLTSDTRIVNRELAWLGEGTTVRAQLDVELWIHRTYGKPNGPES